MTGEAAAQVQHTAPHCGGGDVRGRDGTLPTPKVTPSRGIFTATAACASPGFGMGLSEGCFSSFGSLSSSKVDTWYMRKMYRMMDAQ